MKSFIKKVVALVIVFSMASSMLTNVQGEGGKIDFSMQGDLTSSYIWYGFYQTGTSFQPTSSLGVGNFFLTAWGSTDSQGANSTSISTAKEIDSAAAYIFGSASPTLSVVSLRRTGQGSCRYFDFKSHETDHRLEAGLVCTLPIEKLPLSTAWNFMSAGQDKGENGNRNYSSYVELNPPSTMRGVDLNATYGVLLYDTGIITYGSDVNSEFVVANVVLKAAKGIKTMNSSSLPTFVQTIWNPHMEDIHLVLEISLRP